MSFKNARIDALPTTNKTSLNRLPLVPILNVLTIFFTLEFVISRFEPLKRSISWSQRSRESISSSLNAVTDPSLSCRVLFAPWEEGLLMYVGASSFFFCLSFLSLLGSSSFLCFFLLCFLGSLLRSSNWPLRSCLIFGVFLRCLPECLHPKIKQQPQRWFR